MMILKKAGILVKSPTIFEMEKYIILVALNV